MRVAIDSQTNRTGDIGRGIGFHTKLLIEHLNKFKNLEINLVDTRREKDLKKFDIVHYPAFDTHLSKLPAKFVKPTIVTVHDVIKLIYPRQYPLGIKGKIRFFQQKRRLKNVDAIITISQTSKKDIIRLLGIPASKIFVTYLAPQPISTKVSTTLINQTSKKYKLPQKFVLYIGGVNYNKNLINLAKACKVAKIDLVMIGKETTNDNFDSKNIENKPWVEFSEKFGKDESILRLGYVNDEELGAIWKLASVYCQPSFYEGFGLPLLEAFEHRCPVVASQTQALVEVGDGACLYVDPNSPEEIGSALLKVINDNSIARDLVKLGTKRLENFSWEKTAKQTYEVYKSLSSK